MLRVKQEQIERGEDLLLISTQINRMKTAVSEWKGSDLEMSRLWQAHGLLLEQKKGLRKYLLTVTGQTK